MSKDKNNMGSGQLSLFVDNQAGVNEHAVFTKFAANDGCTLPPILESISEVAGEVVDHRKRVIAAAEAHRDTGRNMATAIMEAQADGHTDNEITEWLLEAEYSISAIRNQLSRIRKAKGQGIRSSGGGRNVKNVELVDRITEFAALILGEGKYSAKDMESALHAGARLVKEGKVTAVEA